MAEFTYKIIKHIGVLSKPDNNGWQKELNIVSYNGREPKYDIRDWAPNREKMAKGVTLNKDEAKKLLEMLSTEEF